MTLGAFAFIAAAAGTALAVQAPATVAATDKAAIEKIAEETLTLPNWSPPTPR